MTAEEDAARTARSERRTMFIATAIVTGLSVIWIAAILASPVTLLVMLAVIAVFFCGYRFLLPRIPALIEVYRMRQAHYSGVAPDADHVELTAEEKKAFAALRDSYEHS